MPPIVEKSHRKKSSKKSMTKIRYDVQQVLKARHPVPPIAHFWRRYREDQAREWDNTCIDRIRQWHAIVGTSVCTQEAFDLNSDC